jgi:hypothetical protein
MGWSFRKSIKILPGIRLNLSKRGVGLSAGVRGAHISSGPRGVWFNGSLPGTGLRYTERLDGQHRHRSVGETDPGRSWVGAAFRLALLACLGFAVYLAFRGL